jgi:hypothetical protein
VPPMKLTPNAAMRARDVSRPRAEHLAEAEAAEASSRPRSRPPSGDAATGTPERPAEKTPGVPAGKERAGRPGFPRRRRARGSR